MCAHEFQMKLQQPIRGIDSYAAAHEIRWMRKMRHSRKDLFVSRLSCKIN